MEKASKDPASRPSVKKGCLIGAIILWVLAIVLYVICFIGIPRDFANPVLEFISQRGLVPAIGFALLGAFLFFEHRK
ncbi:MAG: hypothetical protein IJB90_00685 [Clostridia bacterium]|nr:hypothetical protein [Clostridia bacterium]